MKNTTWANPGTLHLGIATDVVGEDVKVLSNAQFFPFLWCDEKLGSKCKCLKGPKMEQRDDG